MAQIEEEIADYKIKIEVVKDHKITGNFEVTLFNSKHPHGLLIHSKKGGQGFVTKSNISETLENIKTACV